MIELASLPPAQRKSEYVEKSDIDGATPESCHVTVIAPPPVNVAPAAGLVNLTSAEANWRTVVNKERGRAVSRIVSRSGRAKREIQAVNIVTIVVYVCLEGLTSGCSEES